MLFQLGNKQFDGVFSPGSWSYSGNEANLAQYDLINTKPRLQHTGETLEEVSLSFHLRAEFCNISNEINDFEEWKRTGEVLPLLRGDGTYLNDYVIRGIDKNITQTFEDGVPIEMFITLGLLESVSDMQAQRIASDRRNASAVGDKKQIDRRPLQKETPESEAHSALMAAQNEAWQVAESAEKLKEAQNPAQQISRVKQLVNGAQTKMEDTRNKIQNVQQKINNATGIISSINQAKDKLSELGNLLDPPISTDSLNGSILNLQSALRGVDVNSSVFTKDIILRKL